MTKSAEDSAHDMPTNRTAAKDVDDPKYVSPKEAEAMAVDPKHDAVAPAFVGKGSWVFITYHMCAAVASVPTLGLPGAMAGLGWPAGVIALLLGGAVTCFTSFLISSLHTFRGKRHIRYRDLSMEVFGPIGWWYVTPFQFAVCAGSVIANLIIAGQAMKAIYVIVQGDNATVPLAVFIVVFGIWNLLLSQLPHFHGIRYVNMVATVSTLLFVFIAVVCSIRDGINSDRSGQARDYSVLGDPSEKCFSIFNSLGIMAFAYGNTVIPEIQATAREPAVKTMQKGISAAYVVILGSYILVAFIGYWAYGNGVAVIVLGSLGDPSWPVIIAWFAAITQLCGTTQVYAQPIFEMMDKQFGDARLAVWSMRNTLVRLIGRTVFICVCTLIAAALPFFGDFMGFIGAVGYTPMDFILPFIMYIVAFRPTGWKLYLMLGIALLYTLVGLLAAVGAIRLIVGNAVNYHLFANL